MELISPFRSFYFVGNKRIVLKIAGHFQALTATWLGKELVAGREGFLSRSSQTFMTRANALLVEVYLAVRTTTVDADLSGGPESSDDVH